MGVPQSSSFPASGCAADLIHSRTNFTPKVLFS